MKLHLKLKHDADDAVAEDIKQQALTLGAISFELLMDPVRDTSELFQHLYVMEVSTEDSDSLIKHFTCHPQVKYIYPPPHRGPL